jgi:hypothetical protein
VAEVIINDQNYRQFVEDPVVGGDRKARGLVPRNWVQYALGSLLYAKPFDLPLIGAGTANPEAEWQARLDAQIAAKAQLSDIRNTSGPSGGPIPSRDQNGKGYCWAHSSTSAALIARAVMGEPYADLSAYAVACVIKGYRDEGGWGAESLQFIAERGIPTSKTWPQQSMSRGNDKPETWAEAKLYRFTEWMDLDPGQMKVQLVTCLLLGLPVVSDFNWWSHSVCTIDLVSINPFRTRIWNSWGDGWSQNGTGILEGQRALPDSALAARVMTPSKA